MQQLRKTTSNTSAVNTCKAVGANRLCPKVVLEGIPEWVGLKNELQRIGGALGIRQRLTAVTARSLGISSHHRDGKRKAKEALRAEVLKAGGVRKRKFGELKDMVKRAGGRLRLSENGKQRKLNARELQEQLVRLGQ